MTNIPVGSLDSYPAVTPSDTEDLPGGVAIAIYIDVAGPVVLNDANGNTETFSALAVGQWHPMRVTRVLATGTNATVKVGY